MLYAEIDLADVARYIAFRAALPVAGVAGVIWALSALTASLGI